MLKKFIGKIQAFIIDYQWWMIGGLIILSLGLAFTGFLQKLPAGYSDRYYLDALYQTILMFTFESVAQDNVPVTLELARWLAIFIAGFAVVKAVLIIGRKEIDFLRLRFYRDHVIVCGLNNKSTRLINSCFRAKKNFKIVVIEQNPDQNMVSLYRQNGVIIIKGHPADPVLLKKVRLAQAGFFFAFTDDDEFNVEIALLTYQLTWRSNGKRKNKLAANRLLNCFVHILDPNLEALFKQHALFRDPFDGFNGRVINVYETSARSVFNRYPPDMMNGYACHKWDGPPAHVVIVGFSNLGRKIALQVIKLGHYANLKKTRLTVIDAGIVPKRQRFLSNYPGVEEFTEIEFVELEPECLELKLISRLNNQLHISILYFCTEDDSSGYLTACRLAKRLGDADAQNLNNLTLVVCMPENTRLSSVLELSNDLAQANNHATAETFPESGYDILVKPVNLKIFNVISESCSWDVLVDEQLDKVAISLHEDYLATQTPVQRQSKISAREWDALPEEYRDSNRSKADYLMVRERAIFAYYNINSFNDIPAEFENDEMLIERLSKMEHRRWSAEKILSGWTYHPERNEKLKRNDNLLEWDKLYAMKKFDIIKQNIDESRNLRKVLAMVEETQTKAIKSVP